MHSLFMAAFLLAFVEVELAAAEKALRRCAMVAGLLNGLMDLQQAWGWTLGYATKCE